MQISKKIAILTTLIAAIPVLALLSTPKKADAARVFVSWYGPGLYGNKTACGQTLTPRTFGVAHKSLPCGKKVFIRYKGRSLSTRVIDRGPYVGGRSFDLTAAAARAVGFAGLGSMYITY